MPQTVLITLSSLVLGRGLVALLALLLLMSNLGLSLVFLLGSAVGRPVRLPSLVPRSL